MKYSRDNIIGVEFSPKDTPSVVYQILNLNTVSVTLKKKTSSFHSNYTKDKVVRRLNNGDWVAALKEDEYSIF